MSQENVDTVRRLLEACNRRDWDAMLEIGDPEIEIVTLISGTHRGHAGWLSDGRRDGVRGLRVSACPGGPQPPTSPAPHLGRLLRCGSPDTATPTERSDSL
jgi:hypothetical protein